MNFNEVISALSLYGVDVLLFAIITAVSIQLLKKFALKNVEKKFITFLPFIIGTVIYAIYALILFGVEYLLENFSTVFESGISVGTLSTLIYVLYERFKQKNNLSVAENLVLALIESHVKKECAQKIAKAVCVAVNTTNNDEDALLAIEKLLKENADGEIDESEIKAVCSLVQKSLFNISLTKKT